MAANLLVMVCIKCVKYFDGKRGLDCPLFMVISQMRWRNKTLW